MKSLLWIGILIVAGVLVWGFTTHWGSKGIYSSSSPSPTSTASATATTSVSIKDLAFNPATIAVSSGAKVTWTNNDSMVHTVTSDTGAFASQQIQPGGTFEFTFNNPGTFAYHCSIHTSMHGTVIVQ